MANAAPSDDRAVESVVEALLQTLLRAKPSPDAKKALIEARRLKTIAQKWGAIPPQPAARRELLARVEELEALAKKLEVDPDKIGKALPLSLSLDSLAHVSRSGAHAINIPLRRAEDARRFGCRHHASDLADAPRDRRRAHGAGREGRARDEG